MTSQARNTVRKERFISISESPRNQRNFDVEIQQPFNNNEPNAAGIVKSHKNRRFSANECFRSQDEIFETHRIHFAHLNKLRSSARLTSLFGSNSLLPTYFSKL